MLYNYFEDKEDLLAHALLAHVGSVMQAAPRMPPAGTGTVAENLRLFIDRGLQTLARVAPAFAGLVSQPGVLGRFHAMVGGDAAFVGRGEPRRARLLAGRLRAGRLRAGRIRTGLAGCPIPSAVTCSPSSGSAASTRPPTSTPRSR